VLCRRAIADAAAAGLSRERAGLRRIVAGAGNAGGADGELAGIGRRDAVGGGAAVARRDARAAAALEAGVASEAADAVGAHARAVGRRRALGVHAALHRGDALVDAHALAGVDVAGERCQIVAGEIVLDGEIVGRCQIDDREIVFTAGKIFDAGS
jgi:hypothetical protein